MDVKQSGKSGVFSKRLERKNADVDSPSNLDGGLAEIRTKIIEDIRFLLNKQNKKHLDNLESKIEDLARKYDQYITLNSIEILKEEIKNQLYGFGPLEPLFNDESVTEIMVIGPKKIYIERNGDKILSSATFEDEEHIRIILDKIVGPIGKKIDETTPTVDARLPQGFRLNAAIKPIALNGPHITIRKFPSKVWMPEDLVRFGSAPQYVFDFLARCVKEKKNIAVSGGTGSGKTTVLNVLSNFIPPDERLIVIEDCAELKIVGDHVLNKETRPPNTEGKGEISIRDLIKNALRERPDRIIVGEVRGGEAIDMLQAMNTGHSGSMTTGHANSPIDFLSRLEYMCLMSGIDIPLMALRQSIVAALDVIVQIGRVKPNKRRMLEVTEVLGLENGEYVLNSIFVSNFKRNPVEELHPTGKRPTFEDELDDYDCDFVKQHAQYLEMKKNNDL